MVKNDIQKQNPRERMTMKTGPLLYCTGRRRTTIKFDIPNIKKLQTENTIKKKNPYSFEAMGVPAVCATVVLH